MRKLVILLCLYLIVLAGCSGMAAGQGEETTESAVEVEDSVEYVFEEINKEDALPSYDVVYTLEKVASLTFDEVLREEEFIPLLDALDMHDMEATFFVSLDDVNTHPEMILELYERGHHVESNALREVEWEDLEAEEIFIRLKETNEAIEEMIGEQPKYIRLPTPDDTVGAVAAQLDMTGVIQAFGINTSNPEQQTRASLGRGKVLSLEANQSDVIPILADARDEIDFEFISIDRLIELDQGRLSFGEIEGADAISLEVDEVYREPHLHYQEPTDKREVALTFDDWASEAVVLEVLDILDEYEIQSTFYIKTANAEKNPNLARVLVERGHEVANHTHAHPDVTEIPIDELREDVYHAHQIITEAIQEQPLLYFRPPFGRMNDEAAEALTNMGFEVIGMYDLSSYDWNEEYTEEDVIHRVMSNVQPGSVIVMHILDNIHTPSVLPDVIESLQSEGYEFVKTSDWMDEE